MDARIREQDYTRVVELQYTIIPEREKRLTELEGHDLTEIRFLRRDPRSRHRGDHLPAHRYPGLQGDGHRERPPDEHGAGARWTCGQSEGSGGEISRTVRRARAGMQDPHRPLGSFLMLGPTGVGKTELAKALAEFLFDDERSMIVSI